jgi:hypothetical protein
MPPARQPERPCLAIINTYEATVQECKDNLELHVAPHSVEDMEDILRLLKQEEPLPCDWYGMVICGHVAGVRRENGVGDEVGVVPEVSDEYEVDDFVTVATTVDEDQLFWLAQVVEINGDQLKVHWYNSTKEFGTYFPCKGADQGRHTQWVSEEACFVVRTKPDARSNRGGLKIAGCQYGTELNRITYAMEHGRQKADETNSQENE